MQNYCQQPQQQSLQKQQTQIDTKRKTRSAYPDDYNNNYLYNNNININTHNINIKEYPQPANLSILPHQPSPHSDIQSSRILIKQPSLTNKPTQQRKSNWARKQRIKYFVFLNYYSQIPHWGSDLKSIPTYKSLSVFIKTRSPQQCKSYHLSTKRNYKSIEEMLISLKEELKDEEGFLRLVDKYEMDVIAFQMQHKLLQGYGLEQKGYFQQKLVERSKRTTQPIIPGDNTISTLLNPKNYGATNNQPPHQQEQQQCNFKINIKDIMGQNIDQLGADFKSKIEKVNNEINTNENNKGFNNHENLLMSLNVANNTTMFNNTIRTSTSGYSHLPTIPGQQMGYFLPLEMPKYHPSILQQNNRIIGNFPFENMSKINPNNNNKNPTNEVIAKETKSSQQLNNIRQDNLNAQKFYIQQNQNFNRFMEANKNLYNTFHQGYNPYQPNPFMSPNHMQFGQHFRNQLPFSIPPPGGISYMLQGFNDPYGMNPYNTVTASRFGPSLVQQNTFSQSKSSKQKQQQLRKQQVQQKISTINQKSKSQKLKSNYSEKRKELLLECHKHWINWLRAVTQLNKRKQALERQQQQKITANN